ncbi:MAG: hypothetical protein WD428_03305 [Gaiellaceae bacterium]
MTHGYVSDKEALTRRLHRRILDDHVSDCVADALAAGDPEVAHAKGKEMLAAVERFARTR